MSDRPVEDDISVLSVGREDDELVGVGGDAIAGSLPRRAMALVAEWAAS